MTTTVEYVPGFNVELLQDTDLYRSSIDSVLLAHWIQARPHQIVVDLCSGSGIIGLCVTQKFQVTTYLFELQEQLATLAQQSINRNHLQQQVQMINSDVKDVLQYLPHDSTDIISCNPPYFAPKDTPTLGKSLSHNIARHEIYFSQELLAQTASSLLKDNGVLYLVYRLDRLFELSEILKQHHLPIKELLYIHPHVGDDANLVLVKCRKTMRSNGLKVWPSLVLYNNDDTYTKQLQDFIND
ncbi:tRNA1(Val) (adenine(37)-N6)-methyltransferase [Bombilactobacillus thymidiniphilus]|uniref:Methyltransferase n=1 Tax=Bombilactobacillus thymidiniphilus TaxID=2923363 RepID=A0ABY4PCR7_9LACO|nr:methyltransferase [Bombilactobacillus thymidiniphilus]UQS83486.1 methyltransferase [Bombilactobacillus thymidiniphilus]